MDFIAFSITLVVLALEYEMILTEMAPMSQKVVKDGDFQQVEAHRKYYGVENHLRQAPPLFITTPKTTPVGHEPMIDKFYNPNYGYEPYWPGGGWVYRTSTVHPNDTTSGLCGSRCNPIYLRYGEICGRNKYFRETRTFANYCAMRSYDCIDRHGWYIAHRGKCRPPLQVHKAHSIGALISTRTPWLLHEAPTILDQFYGRYNSTTGRVMLTNAQG